VFPFDTESSQEAWKGAVRIKSRADRVKFLTKTLGEHKAPLEAFIYPIGVAEPGGFWRAEVVVKNRSLHSIALSGRPDETPGGSSDFGFWSGSGDERSPDKVNLTPGQEYKFRCSIQEPLAQLLSDPQLGITLRVLQFGRFVVWHGYAQGPADTTHPQL
jgi:hypothetical protein